MEVVIKPLLFLASLGTTINIFQYDNIRNPPNIFDKPEVIETPVNVLNSTYQVLEPGKIPYSRFGVPVDHRESSKYIQILRDFNNMISYSHDTVPILFVSEYRTIDRTVKDNEKPIPGWQVPTRKSHTHYVKAMHYGGRCYALTVFISNVTGDNQVIRRILTDIMGTSGSIGADTKFLWRKAKKAIMESEDVRGEVKNYTVILSTESANMPDFKGIEDLLENMNEFPKYVIPPNPQRNNVPLYVTLRPLHDLDEQYEVVQKNVLAEKYLLQLKQKSSDVDFAYQWITSRIYNTIFSEEEIAFFHKLIPLKEAFFGLSLKQQSIYTKIDADAYKNAFRMYQNGLDNSTENYFEDYKRVREEGGANFIPDASSLTYDVECQKNFLKPTRGSLIVNENEVVKKGSIGSLTECQELCVEDKKCRAVGYSVNEKECLIYYRSTKSARIVFPKSSADFKIYDRKCEIDI